MIRVSQVLLDYAAKYSSSVPRWATRNISARLTYFCTLIFELLVRSAKRSSSLVSFVRMILLFSQLISVTLILSPPDLDVSFDFFDIIGSLLSFVSFLVSRVFIRTDILPRRG